MIAGPRSGFQSRHLGFLSAVVSVAAVLMTPPAADATTIERIVSPGGIEAWLVQCTKSLRDSPLRGDLRRAQ